MTSKASIQSGEWLGSWVTDAPLTPAQHAEDWELLGQVMTPLPENVYIRDLTLWVNGRAYRWERINVVPHGQWE